MKTNNYMASTAYISDEIVAELENIATVLEETESYLLKKRRKALDEVNNNSELNYETQRQLVNFARVAKRIARDFQTKRHYFENCSICLEEKFRHLPQED